MTHRSNMWPPQRIACVVVVCAKTLFVAAVILLLMMYFGSQVRDAGGTVTSVQLKPHR